MKHCTQCGHVLGLGRFCTNCGHPVAARHADPLSDPIDLADGGGAEEWRTDTAERPAAPATPTPERVPPPPLEPRLPPAAVEPPPPPRFPLYADEITPATTATPTSTPVATPAPTASTGEGPAVEQDHRDEDRDGWDDESDEWDDEWDDWDDRRSRAPWIVGGAILLAVLVVGGWLLGRVLGDDPTTTAGDSASDNGGAASDQEPVDRTAEASAEAPRTAPSTQDVDGNPTSYDASNMLDGVPETAWRVAGDGSGIKLVFTFPERTRISEVGLVNGYAKTATDDAGTTFDWYAGHRRITEVTWNFGVGPVVRQALEEGRDLQTVQVDPVEVRKVVLKIVATTAPGEGPARRDFTAISDVFLAG